MKNGEKSWNFETCHGISTILPLNFTKIVPY